MAARYHNITKASKELFVTQPSVSNAIKALEEEFGVNLFYRNNNKLTLTPEVDFHLYEYGSVKACEQVLEKIRSCDRECGADGDRSISLQIHGRNLS